VRRFELTYTVTERFVFKVERADCGGVGAHAGVQRAGPFVELGEEAVFSSLKGAPHPELDRVNSAVYSLEFDGCSFFALPDQRGYQGCEPTAILIGERHILSTLTIFAAQCAFATLIPIWSWRREEPGVRGPSLKRRNFLAAAAASGLTGCVRVTHTTAVPTAPTLQIAPIRAETDRIFRVTVCLRPFRAAGPRLDVEKVGDKTVVHNYGHGGSGWSLSWGSSAIATEKAMSLGEREVAVIGCGALGLTSATLLLRAGAKVTIYAKERPPEVRSARATGSWTPDSRVALAGSVDAGFPALWEKMCRYSFHMYESYLGMAGNPIEWTDRYSLSDEEPGQGRGGRTAGSAPLDFARYQDRVADLTPRGHDLPPGTHPFPTKYAQRTTSLSFNVAGYSRQLLNDFLIEGGKIEHAEYRSPADLQALPQKAIVNCTGYGARALWKDESIVPVRGQIAWLIPQPEVNYGVQYKSVYILGRRDGIVVQGMGIGEMEGYNDSNETPDRAAAEASVGVAAELYRRMADRKV